jgi:prevent-host-death family protein
MKVVALGQAKNELSTYVDEAQSDRVLITRHGKPAVLMIGVEGEELEDLMTRANPRFWEMIEERRQGGKRVSAAELRRRLGAERTRKPAKKRRAR